MRSFLRWKNRIQQLEPGYFALVMATGIVALALDMKGLAGWALVMTVINLAAYGWLLLLNVLRLLLYRTAWVADFVSPQTGVSSLSFVAASGVLSVQCLQIVHAPVAAAALGGVAAFAWLLLCYGFLAVTMTCNQKMPLMQSLHGGWLIIVVATQSIAVSVVGLMTVFANLSTALLFVALCLFCIGTVWYVILIVLLVYRMVFLPLAANELTPPYWINMGALAISTLAGALLVQQLGEVASLQRFVPFATGWTLLLWSFASWWIPLLLLLGVWRHGVQRVPLRYHSSYWNMVFPLGMYAVCTHQLQQAFALDFLTGVINASVAAGFVAWLIVFVGGIRHWLTCDSMPG